MDIDGYMMASPEKILPSKNRMTHVNFTCQRCSQPLKLDSSFRDLDEQTLCDLTAHHILNSDSDNEHDSVQAFQKTLDAIDVSKKLILPVRYTGTGNGFMVVGESLSSCVDNSSNKTLEVTAALFDLMSDKSDIDHPICEECTDNLLDQMDQQLKIAEDECKEYREFLEQLDSKNEEEDLEKLESELKNIAEEEKLLISELCEVEKKEQKLKKELGNYEEEYEQLCQEEDMYWQEYSSLKRQLLLFEEDQHSVENQLSYAQAQLYKLNKTNVFNATFHIWHNDHFGTINNFRLGRLPSAPVDWPEINAAWGQTVLLLNSLAKKIGLTFKDYRLVPYGNHSYIETLNKEANKLPLHCSGGFKFLWNDKFDQGMVAFLDCLQQFKEKAQSTDDAFHLPYKMEKGKLYDSRTKKSYSIKMQLNSEELWTKALKFMLTNLKWGLAWVSSQYAKT